MKTYKVKISKANLKKLKVFWTNFKNLEGKFYDGIRKLEGIMEKETGIEGVEFFQSDTGWCGIGNADRTMKLIQSDKLE